MGESVLELGAAMETGVSHAFLPPDLILPLLLCAVVGYLLGSINWAIILTRLFKNKEDIRTQGSGNAGMTNVLRSVGKAPAALTFVGDFLKCVFACLIAWGVMALFGFSGFYINLGRLAAGVACVLGHAFPLYYGFRGGKCIVTSSAMILMTDWRVFLLIIATFLIVFLAKKIISLGSVVCAALYPIYTFLFEIVIDFRGHGLYSLKYHLIVILATLFVGILVLFCHRANIGRLLRGEEKPITAKKKS